MASAEREPITGVWRRSDPPPPVKTRRICINFRSGKNGVDVSTPVHPVATQLNENDFEIATLEKHQVMLQSVRPSVGPSVCLSVPRP